MIDHTLKYIAFELCYCSILEEAALPRRRLPPPPAGLGWVAGTGGSVASRCFVIAAMGSARNCGFASTAWRRPDSFALGHSLRKVFSRYGQLFGSCHGCAREHV